MVEASHSSDPRDREEPELRRPLGLGERHARFGLIRRAPGTEAEWVNRHWFAIMLPSTLFVAAIFVWAAMANGFIWSTIVFEAFAGLGFLALVVRLLFPRYWQPR